jgi:glycerate kinase
MKILIAFDKFKGALNAVEAVETASEALQRHLPGALCWTAPLSDGGEGFASLIAEAMDVKLHTVKVPGPRFHPVEGCFAVVPWRKLSDAVLRRLDLPANCSGKPVAFVEMASASGYEQLASSEMDPWKTSTYGTGSLLREAANAGAGAIVLGIGGSATNDCGAGALEALGVVYYDRDMQPLSNITPARFREVTSAGGTCHIDQNFPPLRIASDVRNPLLGPQGATATFGPQKGLLLEDIDRMDRTLQKMASRLLGLFGKPIDTWEAHFSEPCSGAAGGIGFALRHACADARFVDGFATLFHLLDLGKLLAEVDCLVTGEGRIDATSLEGKAPVELLRRFGSERKAVFLAGSIDSSTMNALRAQFPRLQCIPLSDPQWPLEEALRRTREQLAKVVVEAFPS